MTQSADQQTILQNSMNTEIMLARMDERMVHLTEKVDRMATALEAKKVSWWQAWGPILATVAALAGVYSKLASDIEELHQVDAASIQQRADMERRINRLEVVALDHAKP